jgi:glycosyltransferase involved in cell wall biosynthesis
MHQQTATTRLPRVGLNAHLLSRSASYRSAGVSHYIDRLLAHLPQVDQSLRYVALAGHPLETRGWETHVSRWRTESPPARILWEQVAQPWRASRARLDLLHAPVYVGPVVSTCPVIVTVHDLSFYRYPELFRPQNRVYLQAMTRRTVQHAAAVIAVSESTRRDIVRLLNVPESRIVVIPNGVDAEMRPVTDVSRREALRQRYDLPDHFMLFLGTLEPRKNLTTLLEAYARYRRNGGRHALVIAGAKGWYYDAVYETASRLDLGDAVRFPGYIPQDELPLWYSLADLFVYPSLYEGFGLPPLEAMACGTPVITSNVSSLPEVMGEGGMCVDPHDPLVLAEAMGAVLGDAGLYRRLVRLGREQSQRYSWAETARQTASLYHRVLGDDDVAER